jgi:isocitrate dehydrogenase kinase/phosphatase
MPLKRVDELYNAIGHNKHGKTELYRELLRHLNRAGARFEPAEGEDGMVMTVITLPSLNVVFKLIKDRFGHPKRTTASAVRDRYALVFRHDRAGRLADAQEFEHLAFPRACFPPELLARLLDETASTVSVRDDTVIIAHLYTERRVMPLDRYLLAAPAAAARDAVLDYGWAIKELAAANIFAGDMLLKNFGVSRHGRVIFYDYDELTLLTDCRFRDIPAASHPDDELAAEPWFPVGEHDVFPEEFGSFLLPPSPHREAFAAVHGDLLDVEWWRAAQRQAASGTLADVFPYPRSRRL